MDLISKTEEFIFSYRIAGVLIHGGKVLLQKPLNDSGYSLPGGHVTHGETSAQALVREFKEEIGADIKVNKLILVGENFFPWDELPCQQIGLYYTVSLLSEGQIPTSGIFRAFDEIGGQRIDLDFVWVPLGQLSEIQLYPEGISQHIQCIPQHPLHFVYRQD
ncbi:MAG: NUDIX hydrolase [Defluviitaleaceae bacterium]|nr:NUDIX hydrolase [Defluviitaleaceae bacterium]